MIRAYIFLFLFVTANSACSEEEETFSSPEVSTPASSLINNVSISGKTFSYLALGDSYTIGQGVEEEDNWPNQLKGQLLSKTVSLSPVQIIAKTGWTTDELKTEINNSNLDYPYDWVSLLIGVNNQSRGRSIQEFRKQFETLLSDAITLVETKKKSL